MYTEKDGKLLLKLARESIKEEFSDKSVKLPNGKKLQEKRGVFVSLKKKGELRGCIGFPYPDLSLSKAVYEAAKNAAFSDPRFLPVQENEIKDLEIEISIMTVPVACGLKNIKIGDGVIIKKQGYSALFLPQVWEELSTKEEFLGSLCMKAGLSRDEWKKKANFFIFSCEIFKK